VLALQTILALEQRLQKRVLPLVLLLRKTRHLAPPYSLLLASTLLLDFLVHNLDDAILQRIDFHIVAWRICCAKQCWRFHPVDWWAEKEPRANRRLPQLVLRLAQGLQINRYQRAQVPALQTYWEPLQKLMEQEQLKAIQTSFLVVLQRHFVLLVAALQKRILLLPQRHHLLTDQRPHRSKDCFQKQMMY
jgi:hypothetical protein